ncbi:MAG: TonB-dependent receptor [Alphaproteobacteria bacterium]
MDILSGPGPSVRDGNKKEGWNLRGQLLWKPSESTSVRFIVDGAHKDDECCYAAVWRPGSFGRAAARPSPRDPDDPRLSRHFDGRHGRGADRLREPHPPADRGRVGRVGRSELQFRLGELHLGDGLSRLEARRRLDDYTAADLLWTDPDVGFQHFKTFTQEFRPDGSSGSSTGWSASSPNETLERETSTVNGADTEAFGVALSPGASATATRATLAAVQVQRPGSPTYLATYGNVNTHALNTGLHDYYDQSAESIALFTHNTIKLTDQLKLTLGLRYTSETKEVDATYRTNVNTGCAYLEGIYGSNPQRPFHHQCRRQQPRRHAPRRFTACPGPGRRWTVLTASALLNQTKDENEFSGIATLAYEFDENFNAYLSFSRGYKAGGFNSTAISASTTARSRAGRSSAARTAATARRPRPTCSATSSPRRAPIPARRRRRWSRQDLSFAPEFVDAFELGAKATLAGGKLQANLAIFHQKFTDYQLNSFTGISFVVTSVPEVLSTARNWTSTGTRISRASRSTRASPTPTPVMVTIWATTARLGSFLYENPNLFYLPGSNLTSAPTWTLTGGVTYEFPIAGGAWRGLAHADARYVIDHRTGSNLDPAKTQVDYLLLNASASRPKTNCSPSSCGARTCSTSATPRSVSTPRCRATRRPPSTARPPRSARSARSRASRARWGSR